MGNPRQSMPGELRDDRYGNDRLESAEGWGEGVRPYEERRDSVRGDFGERMRFTSASYDGGSARYGQSRGADAAFSPERHDRGYAALPRDDWRSRASIDPQNIGKGPRGYRRSDERIKDEVCEQLSRGYLDASDIDVHVKDGVVHLGGTARDKSAKRLAEDIAESCGATSVENDIRVATTASREAQGAATRSETGNENTNGTDGKRDPKKLSS